MRTAILPIRRIVPGRADIEMLMRLSWRPDQPLGVTAEIGPKSVTWVLGRDLLYAGLVGAAGHYRYGDVRVHPAAGGRTRIVLRDDRGHAVLAVPTQQLRAFLDATFAEVPAGTEHEHMRIPATVDELLEMLPMSESGS